MVNDEIDSLRSTTMVKDNYKRNSFSEECSTDHTIKKGNVGHTVSHSITQIIYQEK